MFTLIWSMVRFVTDPTFSNLPDNESEKTCLSQSAEELILTSLGHFPTVIHFPALSTPYLFSCKQNRFPVFPRLAPVAVFVFEL